jgi:NADH dehydrogenase/NADH:ubiquinone oxidoreductase subunit G
VPFAHNGIMGGGGGTLVVVGPDNGLHRDTKAWLHCTRENTLKALQDLVAALEGKGSDEAKQAAAMLTERPASIVAGAGVASHPEGVAALEKLRALLGCSDEASFTGGIDLSGNAGGARAILGDLARVDAAGKDGVLSQGVETLLVIGDVPHVDGFPVKDTGSARVIWATAQAPEDGKGVPDCVDVILPLADLYEQAGSFTNIEGRHQGFDAGGIPPGKGAEKAKADWELVSLLLAELGVHMPKDLKALRATFAGRHGFATLPPNKTALPTSLNVM